MKYVLNPLAVVVSEIVLIITTPFFHNKIYCHCKFKNIFVTELDRQEYITVKTNPKTYKDHYRYLKNVYISKYRVHDVYKKYVLSKWSLKHKTRCA